MKLTKETLRKLILESLYENEEKFADQIDIEDPQLAAMKEQAYMLDDKLSRLLLQIKAKDPHFELNSQSGQY